MGMSNKDSEANDDLFDARKSAEHYRDKYVHSSFGKEFIGGPIHALKWEESCNEHIRTHSGKAELRRRLKGVTLERDRYRRKAQKAEAMAQRTIDNAARAQRSKQATLITVIGEKDARIAELVSGELSVEKPLRERIAKLERDAAAASELDAVFCMLNPDESVSLRRDEDGEFWIDVEFGCGAGSRAIMRGTCASVQSCMTPPQHFEEVSKQLEELRNKDGF